MWMVRTEFLIGENSWVVAFRARPGRLARDFNRAHQSAWVDVVKQTMLLPQYSDKGTTWPGY